MRLGLTRKQIVDLLEVMDALSQDTVAAVQVSDTYNAISQEQSSDDVVFLLTNEAGTHIPFSVSYDADGWSEIQVEHYFWSSDFPTRE